jgi:adenosyl cobinamide kinase/adenosyl cobinamide phosphate guanylyltransferase
MLPNPSSRQVLGGKDVLLIRCVTGDDNDNTEEKRIISNRDRARNDKSNSKESNGAKSVAPKTRTKDIYMFLLLCVHTWCTNKARATSEHEMQRKII